MTVPTEDELEALINPVWLDAKPGVEAQAIRAMLCSSLDKIFVDIPDYVWSLVDIAAQRGIELGRRG